MPSHPVSAVLGIKHGTLCVLGKPIEPPLQLPETPQAEGRLSSHCSFQKRKAKGITNNEAVEQGKASPAPGPGDKPDSGGSSCPGAGHLGGVGVGMAPCLFSHKKA